jgi:hypothetical protein
MPSDDSLHHPPHPALEGAKPQRIVPPLLGGEGWGEGERCPKHPKTDQDSLPSPTSNHTPPQAIPSIRLGTRRGD